MAKTDEFPKLENKQIYMIKRDSEIIKAELRDYHSPVCSGLEADEEKEYHLKNVLANGDKKIFTPHFSKTEVKKTYENFILEKNYLKTQVDIPISIYTEEELSKLNVYGLSYENIQEMLINNTLVETVDNMIDNDEIKEIFNRKQLKTVDYVENDRYVCFRKRIIYTPRKSKKHDAIINDKLNNLCTEIYLIYKSMQLCKKYEKMMHKKIKNYFQLKKLFVEKINPSLSSEEAVDMHDKIFSNQYKLFLRENKQKVKKNKEKKEYVEIFAQLHKKKKKVNKNEPLFLYNQFYKKF